MDESIDTGAKYEISMKALAIKLLDHTDTVCGDTSVKMPAGIGTLTVHGVTCPAPAGDMQFAMDMTLPSTIPAFGESANIHMTGTDQTGGKLMCVDVSAKIVG